MAGVSEGECMGRSPEDESLTFMRCHSCGLPQLYEAFEVEIRLWLDLQLEGHKGKFYVFSSLS